MSLRRVVIVGCGVFGVGAAIELQRRGFEVEVIDPGPLPSPDASSTDISKAARVDYGGDEFYVDLAERALDRWREWNRDWATPPFHEVGFLLMTPSPMTAGEFEADGFELLSRRGHQPRRLDAATRHQYFPLWSAPHLVDGYFNDIGGWVEADRVMEHLIAAAVAHGVLLREGWTCVDLCFEGSRVTGARLQDGQVRSADFVLVCAGAWTPVLLPQLADLMWPTAQPVLHFAPDNPEAYVGDRFPVWGADITRTGWYGFPATEAGVVKIGNHGPGRRVHPDDPREIGHDVEQRFREFLASTLPDLAEAPLVGGRHCLYCDTWDGNFWIDHDPDHEGLVVACGGSGHGFKFAPLIGEIIADVVEGLPNDDAHRFAWRTRGKLEVEASRRRS